jgi:ABC-2 type transport system permease protein
MIILILIEAGMYSGGHTILDTLTNNLSENFYLQGNLMNGYLVTYFALNTLWIHIPILIVIVTGDLVSGEASAGTFRLILTRPVSRNTLITAKFVTSLLYILVLMIVLFIFSMGLGIILFGKGDLMVFLNGINIIPASELPMRFVWAFLFGLISMWMVGSLSFLLSCIYENSLTPILVSMAIIILFTILSNFDVGLFDKLKPYLFTTYMGEWRSFFNFKINQTAIGKALGILFGHIVILYLGSLIIFNKKDITT